MKRRRSDFVSDFSKMSNELAAFLETTRVSLPRAPCEMTDLRVPTLGPDDFDAPFVTSPYAFRSFAGRPCVYGCADEGPQLTLVLPLKQTTPHRTITMSFLDAEDGGNESILKTALFSAVKNVECEFEIWRASLSRGLRQFPLRTAHRIFVTRRSTFATATSKPYPST
jgi:hypothetical protein